MDVHKESMSIAARNDAGKIVMGCVIETKANIILDFIHGLRGELQVTFEEGTWATWLYDLLKPHVAKLVVTDPRKNSRQGNKNDRIDARELSDRLYMNKLSSVYHGGAGVRTLRELARSYLTIAAPRKSPANVASAKTAGSLSQRHRAWLLTPARTMRNRTRTRGSNWSVDEHISDGGGSNRAPMVIGELHATHT